MWTRDLATADASCGGKAFGLARLIGAGLRVPDGFVIDGRAFRVATGDVAVTALHESAVLEPDPGISLVLGKPAELGHTLGELATRVETVELPHDLVEEVVARARSLGGSFAVRSSATIEDREAGAAAGVFSSRTAVPIEELWPAIRSVWISALTPLAATYARRRGGEIAISVIVQRYVEGELVTSYTRPPGAPTADEVWWQHGDELSKTPRQPSPLLEAETAIGADGGADLEMIVPRFDPMDWASAWFVQARSIVHPVLAPRTAPPPTVLALLADRRRWTLDLAHNPDPLSIAQADLVERVDRAGIAPWSARVCAGYLYTTPKEVLPHARVGDAVEIHRRSSELQLEMGKALTEPAPTLAVAIDRYLAFFQVWAQHGRLIAAGRASYPIAAERGSAVESILLAAAADSRDPRSLLAGLGVLAPAWDVAVPTFAERPGVLEDALARARVVVRDRRRLAPDTTPSGYAEAAMIADLAEIDDSVFAQAQWMVRKAILERADELGIAREDAFWIPLDDLIRGELDATDAGRRASGARAAAARAATWNMPIVVGDPASSTRDPAVALRGIGSGHRITGRVRRFESLASAIVVSRGDIVVTRAVTPALAVIVIGCAAIISETGGVLDHGAAMARELGIPCIVGCRDAWSQLAEGMIVSLDGDAVTITR